MPDEALTASLQGRPRQAPDFSPLALSHLHSSCLAVRQLVKQYLTNPTQPQLESLSTAVKDIHHTLQLLDRSGALLVTAELSLLLDAIVNKSVKDADACAHSLVFAGERLADYVAHLQRPGAVDSALPLLPVINNCRACRGEELLSEMLVVASGIDLPDASNLPLPNNDELDNFLSNIRGSRQPLMSGLVGWFTDEAALQSSLSDLSRVFAGLSSCCDAPTSLQPLVPLFDCAEFICHSVRRGGLESSAAVHRLFAQLERLLDSYTKIDRENPDAFAKPVPERLFLNMLYYVALSSETSSKAVALRRRFRLDRFVSRGITTDRSQVVFDGVGDRLADSIRDAIEMETEAARNWLGNEHASLDQLSHVHDRLSQLEPAIMLLGAPESMRQLRIINASLHSLLQSGPELESRLRERTADALVRLERALDTELNAVRARSTATEHSDLESILAACLSEAQLRLLEIEEDLITLFGPTPRPNDSLQQSDAIKIAEVNAKFSLINSALQVLPLPEVSPLISGLQSFISRHEKQTLSRGAHRDLATVMVSLGYYLNSVLQPNGAAGQLLLEAEEALLQLDIEGLETNDDTLSDHGFDNTHVLGSDAANASNVWARAGIARSRTQHHRSDSSIADARRNLDDGDELDATMVDYTLDTEAEQFIDISLQQMSVINDTLFAYEQAGIDDKTDERQALRSTLLDAYRVLTREGSSSESAELVELAEANIRLLESSNNSREAQTLLEESVAVLPQLINQMHSSSDKVYGLQALLDQLNDAAQDDLTLAMDVQSILSLSDTSDATLGMPDTVAFDETQLLNFDGTATDSSVMTLDNTLEQVFFRECDQHLASLRKSVSDALSSTNWDSDSQKAALDIATQKAGMGSPGIAMASALPNRDMLRALHTLTGSAQTVDAQGIIAIAQPLQKAALQKQRSGERFDRAETEYISEQLDVLQARLDAMEADQPFTDDNQATLARLQEFVARSEPWMPERKAGLALSSDVASIESVFEEEARELLESLRSESLRLADDDQRDNAIDNILSRLHTIKGSARMAGQAALADRAHELEDEIRLADGVTLDESVANGLGELQTLLLVETPVLAEPVARTSTLTSVSASVSATKQSEPMGLTEASFENMLSLATRATVSQAKLGESLVRLREACRDIESTSLRLQRLPHENTALQSAAVAEMLSDLDSAQRMLADALLDADAEHMQGSRADASLHQTLIHAQLVSLAESQPRLAHAASDAANETGKPIEFSLLGGELNIDKATHRKLMIPLEHLIRNAVVHGIEADVERSASGKSAKGSVSVEAKIDGTDLLIEVRDDGVGIDADFLLSKSATESAKKTKTKKQAKSKAKAKSKSAPKAVSLSPDKILDLLCEPGFTTLDSVDQLSGRGQGLSTVKQLVTELDGALTLSLPEQGGTVFSLRVPQKIRINQVVLVEHHARLFAIPVNFVHTVSDEEHDFASADIQFNGNDYNCCALDAIVNGDIASNASSNGKRVILLGVHDKNIALLVDNVVGYREVIAQPLGAQYANMKRYMGGCILADGSQVLIPDFNRLVSPETALPMPNWGAANASVMSRTALVVDDSITMRIAAEQMLQNMNIEPSLARDGAEAVELISEGLPDVLLVDIDMPRMNGFDFLQHLSVVHPNHTVPIIMISTRDTNADRERASALGAQYYLVKPYTEEQMQSVLSEAGLIKPRD